MRIGEHRGMANTGNYLPVLRSNKRSLWINSDNAGSMDNTSHPGRAGRWLALPRF